MTGLALLCELDASIRILGDSIMIYGQGVWPE